MEEMFAFYCSHLTALPKDTFVIHVGAITLLRYSRQRKCYVNFAILSLLEYGIKLTFDTYPKISNRTTWPS